MRLQDLWALLKESWNAWNSVVEVLRCWVKTSPQGAEQFANPA